MGGVRGLLLWLGLGLGWVVAWLLLIWRRGLLLRRVRGQLLWLGLVTRLGLGWVRGLLLWLGRVTRLRLGWIAMLLWL